jgi:hypothetical protein
MNLDQLATMPLDQLCDGSLFWWEGRYEIAAGEVTAAGAQCGRVA